MNRSRTSIRKLVKKLNSYTQAAKRLNLSKQRVHELAGPGLTGRHTELTCIDCGVVYSSVKGLVSSQRCPRCRSFFYKHGLPYSPETAQKVQEAGRRRSAQKRTATHCLRGHEMSGDNLYVSPKGKRTCRACRKINTDRYLSDPNNRERIREYRKQYGAKHHR